MRPGSCSHLLDSPFGDDSRRGGVKDLLKALQLEPVHPAVGRTHTHTHTRGFHQPVTSLCHTLLHNGAGPRRQQLDACF